MPGQPHQPDAIRGRNPAFRAGYLLRGTVFGLDRTIPIENMVRSGLVQTDAAISASNSGPPVPAESRPMSGTVP